MIPKGHLFCQSEELRLIPEYQELELQGIFQLVTRIIMANTRKSLSSLRKRSFLHQNGYCYYCNQPMWNSEPTEFSKKHSITIKQARQLQCTGEHLLAHSLGGSATNKNIVAACTYCNRKRHQRVNNLSPTAYKLLVTKRLEKKGWHGLILH